GLRRPPPLRPGCRVRSSSRAVGRMAPWPREAAKPLGPGGGAGYGWRPYGKEEWMSDARDLATVLARFPKTRPTLPPKLAAIYTRQYLENRAGATPAASLSQRLERWLHRQVAADVAAGPV